jgi:hypothetical protein
MVLSSSPEEQAANMQREPLASKPISFFIRTSIKKVFSSLIRKYISFFYFRFQKKFSNGAKAKKT